MRTALRSLFGFLLAVSLPFTALPDLQAGASGNNGQAGGSGNHGQAGGSGNHGPDGETIDGDLYVTGKVDVGGNSVTMGTHAGSFGLALLYDDSLPEAFRFRLARPGAWMWDLFDSTLALTPLMRLGPTGTLALYSNGAATVSLDAAARSLSLGDASLYRDSTGALHTEAAVSIGGNLSAAGFTSATGAMTGGTTGLTLNAGGTNQNIVLAPSGTGAVLVQGNLLPAADNLYALGNATHRWSQLTSRQKGSGRGY